MNSLSYHLSNGVKQFADGETFHWRIEISWGIENNSPKWFIAYWINGRGYQFERFAGYGARYHHLYCRGIENAVMSARMRIDNRIEKIRPLEVWVCPKPTPVPSAIIPYGSLFTPVTYAPVQAVISEPLPDARKRLAGEMLELTHITYAPMGRVVRWLAVAEFEGEKVHFPIFAEHASLFPLAGHARLPYTTKDMPRIEIIIEWNEPHHDLRIAGVVSSNGTIHKLGDAPERKRTDWRNVNLKIGSGLKRDAQGNVIFTNEPNEQKAS